MASAEYAASHPDNAAFVAAHLTNSRFYLLNVLGVEARDPLAPYLDGRTSLDDLQSLPPIADIQAAWTNAAHLLRDRLDALAAADLDALWAASNLEEDWQIEQWGQDDQAAARQVRRRASFGAASQFSWLSRE